MNFSAFSPHKHFFPREFSRSKSVRMAAGLALLVFLISCESQVDQTAIKPVPVSPVSAEQQRLEDFFAATWQEDLTRAPASASYLGVRE